MCARLCCVVCGVSCGCSGGGGLDILVPPLTQTRYVWGGTHRSVCLVCVRLVCCVVCCVWVRVCVLCVRVFAALVFAARAPTTENMIDNQFCINELILAIN